MITVDATDTVTFDPQTATLLKLVDARWMCINILDEHNTGKARYLDDVALQEVKHNKWAIEDAARSRFGVRVWLV